MFGLLIVEELPTADPGIQIVLSAIVLTILLSVVAHEITGRPFARWMTQQPETAPQIADPTGDQPRPRFGL